MKKRQARKIIKNILEDKIPYRNYKEKTFFKAVKKLGLRIILQEQLRR